MPALQKSKTIVPDITGGATSASGQWSKLKLSTCLAILPTRKSRSYCLEIGIMVRSKREKKEYGRYINGKLTAKERLIVRLEGLKSTESRSLCMWFRRRGDLTPDQWGLAKSLIKKASTA